MHKERRRTHLLAHSILLFRYMPPLCVVWLLLCIGDMKRFETVCFIPVSMLKGVEKGEREEDRPGCVSIRASTISTLKLRSCLLIRSLLYRFYNQHGGYVVKL